MPSRDSVSNNRNPPGMVLGAYSRLMNFPLPEIQQIEKLCQDIRRSEEMHADIRAKLARGKYQDLAAAWDAVEQLVLDTGKRIRLLKPE
jgi:hypothetical protein